MSKSCNLLLELARNFRGAAFNRPVEKQIVILGVVLGFANAITVARRARRGPSTAGLQSHVSDGFETVAAALARADLFGPDRKIIIVEY